VKHDVTEFMYVDGPVDYILHFASPASPIDYLKSDQTLKVGSLGTHKASALQRRKCPILLASTSEVTVISGTPQPKRTGGTSIRSDFARVRRGETVCRAMTMAYRRYHGTETRIVRIFNTYGPRMRLHDGRAIPPF